jgi:hypothetical protein
MHEESRHLEVELAAVRATVERLAVEQERTRQELRADIRRLDDRLFQTQLAVLATLATTIGALVTALVA